MNTQVRVRCPKGATGVKIAYSCWQADVVGTNAFLCSCSIEYPCNSGTFFQGLFSGSPTHAFNPGEDGMFDVAGLTLPAGAEFYVRSYCEIAPGDQFPVNVLSGGQRSASVAVYGFAGDGFTCNDNTGHPFQGANINADITLGGTIPLSSYALGIFCPVAVIGTPTVSGNCAVFIFGDSREQGDPFWAGPTAYQFEHDTRICWINGAISGEQGSGTYGNLNTATSYRGVVALSVCNAVIGELAVNDFSADRTAANMETYVGYYNTFFASIPRFYLTTWPRTNSTDGWATAVNQTPFPTAGNAFSIGGARDQFLAWLRPGGSGNHLFTGVFDTSATLETPGSEELWLTNGSPDYLTADGLHQYTPTAAPLMAPAYDLAAIVNSVMPSPPPGSTNQGGSIVTHIPLSSLAL